MGGVILKYKKCLYIIEIKSKPWDERIFWEQDGEVTVLIQ